MALTMAVDATCDDVETISTCSGGSADDQAQDPWPDTDDECCYPKSYYRPPRDCKETDCLAEFLTEKAKNTSEMRLNLQETLKFSNWLLSRLQKEKEKNARRPLPELPNEVATMLKRRRRTAPRPSNERKH